MQHDVRGQTYTGWRCTGDGLASVLSTCCSACAHTITIESSEKVKGPNGYRQRANNRAVVWGRLLHFFSQLEEAMSILRSPWSDSRCCSIVCLSSEPMAGSKSGWYRHGPKPYMYISGLVQFKYAHSMQHKTLVEAYQSSSFCLEEQDGDQQVKYKLKWLHNYYFQVQRHAAVPRGQGVVWICAPNWQTVACQMHWWGQDMVGESVTKAAHILLWRTRTAAGASLLSTRLGRN